MVITWPVSRSMLAAGKVDNVEKTLKNPAKALPRLPDATC